MRVPCVVGRAGFGVRVRHLTLAVVVLVLAVSPARARESGIQFSPDGKRVFVNKDVDGVRFAITLNTADGTVTGNAFDAAGGEAKFIICTPEPPVANRFICSVADPCTAAPCDAQQYVNVGERTVPPDFFTGIGSAMVEAAPASGTASSVAAALDANNVVARVAAIASDRASGIQQSPDGKRIFVSKDVDDTRFAITRNADDPAHLPTVTGNVFSFSGGPPTFIICDQTINDLTFDCAAAPPCTTTPCQPFVDVGTRTVPPGFFDLPNPIVGASALSDEITNTMRAGVGTIPHPSGVGVAAVTAPTPCTDGGTVQFGEGAVAFDQCRIGKLVCTGTATASGTSLNVSGLQCHDDARVRDLELSGDVVFGPSGFTGMVSAMNGGAAAFDMEYMGVALGASSFGTPTSGALNIHNPTSFFGGFTEIDQTFDGSQFILIREFFPFGNFIQVLVLQLDVTTGKLTPR